MQTKEERKKQYEERKKQYKEQTYISAFEPGTLIPGILIAFFSRCRMYEHHRQIRNDTKHIPAGSHRSHAGGPHPPECLSEYCNLERQNLLQTIASAAGFSAANCGFIAVAMLFLMGEASSILMMGHWMHDRHLRLHLHHRPHI